MFLLLLASIPNTALAGHQAPRLFLSSSGPVDPGGEFHFHTGRYLAARLGYDADVVDALPDAAVESFAGVANPFSPEGARVESPFFDASLQPGFRAENG